MNTGMADLEAKLERLPRLTAPLPPVITAPTVKPDIRLPGTSNTTEPFSSRSPSDSILEARMMRRKHNHLSEDRTYLKPNDHFLQPLDRVHKRTISAPNPAQGSAHSFLRTSTALSSFASRHPETATQPPPQLNSDRHRLDLERYPWVHQGGSSPAPSMATKSPFESQESSKVLPDRSPQGNAIPQASSNDRVVAACRRFRKVDVNATLEGGDICMAVENCTTGSVPRKVISHLFGRNKVCTRRIPERVWVCAEFSVTQIGMVYEQIVRMIFWSRGLENTNRTNQEGIAIRSWTFSIRRREVKRLADTNSRDLVPRWIMSSLGEGKTHDEILDVVERLHQEIQQGVLKEVPPVEFLPEVVDAFTNAPPQLQTHFSSGGEASFSNHSSRSLNTGESTESPASFVKESSPLEPVQEEGSMSDHSSEQSSSSPTPPAAYSGNRPVHHPQSLASDVSSRATTYAFGAQSPLAESSVGPDTDRRPSLAYHHSQNPLPPPINYSSINRQMQAPMTDHRGSFDNSSTFHEAYSGDYHYGPNGGERASHIAGYVGHDNRDKRNVYAVPTNPQLTTVSPHSHLYGFRMSRADTSLSPSASNARSCLDVPHPQAHEQYWYSAETRSNTRIGRSVSQYKEHTLACVDEASLHSSRQAPREGISRSPGVDLAPEEGFLATYSASIYGPRYQHDYASTGVLDGGHTCGNYQTFDHDHLTNGNDEDWQCTWTHDSSNRQGNRFTG
ncbi:hypothetical protein FHETE_3433 [Fusarium heterosporum]|uniref:Uncharacterized protein n=1 Tax=Fusarium heterosporum TaxID=42747 RepID=A0A8H5WX58_FUSHE|nr:hypothetical protein FHETE_3433 [Fusarium heterosporum]